ncbi:hypothetical protein EDI_050860, partial [Entamoeba dispar SAW760]
MENQEKSKTVQQTVSELIQTGEFKKVIERIIEEHDLKICDLETNLEIILTKSKIKEGAIKFIKENINKIDEEIRKIKEENEKTSKELKGHEIQIDENTLNIEVQNYLINKIMKEIKGERISEEKIKELVEEECKKRYLQKRKEKNERREGLAN